MEFSSFGNLRHWETGKAERARKLESEDLPFVRECNKLREIAGCIRTCLEMMDIYYFGQVCYGCRFAVWEAVDAAFFAL